jgi:hypothetical protein
MSLVMLGILAAFIGAVMVLLARSADPIRRQEAAAEARPRTSQPRPD